MNVQCPQCQTMFRVDPAKVPEGGVRARCSVCAGVFFVEGRTGEEAHAPPRVAAARGAPAVPAAPGTAPPVPPPPAWSAPAPAPGPSATPVPASVPPVAEPVAAPLSVRPPVIPRAPGAAPAPPPAGGAPVPASPAPPAIRSPALAPTGSAPPAAPKRVINPFLSQDPGTKARRLARALISDLVAYNPAKRSDGLRDGSLKILFEEEIKKCWDEYVEQVGTPMATSTPFFTEALNEILADGRPVFS